MTENEKKEVEIIFSTTKKPTLPGWIVKTHLGTEFSHICFKIWSPYYERMLVYEASGSGVSGELYGNWIKKNKVIDCFAFEVENERKRKIIQFAIDNLGKKYNVLALIGMFFEDRLGIKNDWGEDGVRRLICSEFTYLCLKDEIERVLVSMSQELDRPDHLDPLEIYQLLVDFRQKTPELLG